MELTLEALRSHCGHHKFSNSVDDLVPIRREDIVLESACWKYGRRGTVEAGVHFLLRNVPSIQTELLSKKSEKEDDADVFKNLIEFWSFQR